MSRSTKCSPCQSLLLRQPEAELSAAQPRCFASCMHIQYAFDWRRTCTQPFDSTTSPSPTVFPSGCVACGPCFELPALVASPDHQSWARSTSSWRRLKLPGPRPWRSGQPVDARRANWQLFPERRSSRAVAIASVQRMPSGGLDSSRFHTWSQLATRLRVWNWHHLPPACQLAGAWKYWAPWQALLGF
jgi:hypothetical protein